MHEKGKRREGEREGDGDGDGGREREWWWVGLAKQTGDQDDDGRDVDESLTSSRNKQEIRFHRVHWRKVFLHSRDRKISGIHCRADARDRHLASL